MLEFLSICIFRAQIFLEINVHWHKYWWLAVINLLFTWIYNNSLAFMAYSGKWNNRQRFWLLHWLEVLYNRKILALLNIDSCMIAMYWRFFLKGLRANSSAIYSPYCVSFICLFSISQCLILQCIASFVSIETYRIYSI